MRSKETRTSAPCQRWDARRVCGILTAALCCLIAAHMVMGGLSLVFDIPRALKPVVWVGVALLVGHILICIVTSFQMMTDAVRPPSRKKKRHFVLKWVTGALVVATAAAHVIGRAWTDAPADAPAALALSAALAAFAAWHACVGAKSLLKDLDIDRRYRTLVRAVAIAVAAFAALAAVCTLGL